MKKIVLALACACLLNAQTLDELIEKVLLQNPEIKSMEAEAKAMSEEAVIMGKLDNPQLGIQVTNIDFANPIKRNIEPMQQIMYSLSQNIPVTAKLSAREDAKKYTAQAISHRVSQKKLDIEFALRQNGYELAKAKETKKIYEKYLQTLKFALELSRASSITGGMAHNELIRGDMEIASFMRKINDLDAEEKAQARRMKSFGVTVDEDVSIRFDMPQKDVKGVTSEHSKEYASANTMTESFQKELRSESLSLIPDIGVTVGYASSDVKFRDYWFFGVSIPLPIYGKENAAIRKKSYELTAKKEESENLKNNLAYDLESSKIKYETARKNYALTDRVLKTQLGHLLESALAASKTSDSSKAYAISTVKDALSLELELIGYKYEANVALAQIKKLSGQEI